MKIRLYVLIAVLVSALCACSDSPATEPEQDNNSTEQPGGSQDEDSGKEQERKVYFTNPVINSDVPDICIATEASGRSIAEFATFDTMSTFSFPSRNSA